MMSTCQPLSLIPLPSLFHSTTQMHALLALFLPHNQRTFCTSQQSNASFPTSLSLSFFLSLSLTGTSASALPNCVRLSLCQIQSHFLLLSLSLSPLVTRYFDEKARYAATHICEVNKNFEKQQKSDTFQRSAKISLFGLRRILTGATSKRLWVCQISYESK